jgi:hypothetical protein
MATTTVPVTIETKLSATTPKVSVGFSTLFGVVGTIVAAIAAGVAAAKGNDAVGVVSAAGAIVAAVTTQLGRYGQAIAIARGLAHEALPYVKAAADLPDPAPTVPPAGS